MIDLKREPAPDIPTAFMDDAMVAAVETYLRDAEVYVFDGPDDDWQVPGAQEED